MLGRIDTSLPAITATILCTIIIVYTISVYYFSILVTKKGRVTERGHIQTFFSSSFHTSCANRAQLATVWSTRDTCTVCGHPTMSNYFTIYKIVAVLAFTYHSGYHCYYLSDYKLGVHVYCLWPLGFQYY